jgi:phosphatidylglycerol---prolipoprotein diacylglyceryl transferase
MLYVGFVVGVVSGGAVTHLDYTRFAVSALVLLVPALIGGRLWYLLGHSRRRTKEAGGAGIYGGLVLSFVVSWPVLRLSGFEFWRFWDGAAVVLLVGMAFTRFGCLMTGCCAGRETSSRYGMWLPDASGEWRRRYPTQLYESALSATVLGVGLWLYSPSAPAGVLFLGSAAAYGTGRLILEWLRADAVSTAPSTRMNVVFSGLLAVSSLAVLLLKVFAN